MLYENENAESNEANVKRSKPAAAYSVDAIQNPPGADYTQICNRNDDQAARA